MISINIKDQFGDDAIKREHGLRLRTLLESNWVSTDFFEIDFCHLKIASVSFFDEAFGKLVHKSTIDELKTKIKIKNIDEFDRQLLNNVIADRFKK